MNILSAADVVAVLCPRVQSLTFTCLSGLITCANRCHQAKLHVFVLHDVTIGDRGSDDCAQ